MATLFTLVYNFSMSTPILLTKLSIPQSRPALVHRHRLIEQLNSGLQQKLTLVSAPAGFGKTTVVTDWLQTEGDHRLSPFYMAWLSLDEGDNDPVQFLIYLIASLVQAEAMDVKFGNGLQNMLQSPQPPPLDSILISLINEISSSLDQIVIIFDDYHRIQAQPIHNILTFLLENLPPLVHVVITTREDPSLPLARLRAQNQLSDLRASDLLFSYEEAEEFLNQVMGLSLSAEDIDMLEIRTEGWIVGLQLAAISMQGLKDVTSFIRTFSGSNRLVLDYLIEEVINNQPEEVQIFLLQTAILDRLSGSLCNAVTGQSNGQAMLEMLESTNLFVIQLDNKRQWFRYHHLFAELLQQRLQISDADLLPKLHIRASKWYEENDLISFAIDHALSAPDMERAADLIERQWRMMDKNHKSAIWLGWVKALPEEMISRRPVLTAQYAWALLDQGELEMAESHLVEAEKWLDSEGNLRVRDGSMLDDVFIAANEEFYLLPVTIANERAWLSQARGDIQGTIFYGVRALKIASEENYFERGLAAGLLGFAYWANGDLELACQTMKDAITYMRQDNSLQFVISWTSILVDIMVAKGDLVEARYLLERTLQLANDEGQARLPVISLIYLGLCMVDIETGDLESAKNNLKMSEELYGKDFLARWQRKWYSLQAQISKAQGDLENSVSLLEQAEKYIFRHAVPNIIPVSAMKARIWVKQGKLELAMDWIKENDLSITDALEYLKEYEHITFARIMLAEFQQNGNESYIGEIKEFLETLLLSAKEGGRVSSIIEILVLKAITSKNNGEFPEAILSLDNALGIAEPQNQIKIFLDDRDQLAEILLECSRVGENRKFAKKILGEIIDGTERSIDAVLQNLIEPLSDRELEVLQLIADGHSRQEIATNLFLSVNTVKTHLRNIYGKLGVNSQMQAVGKARLLGLLEKD